jgi:hypothetical protein
MSPQILQLRWLEPTAVSRCVDSPIGNLDHSLSFESTAVRLWLRSPG